MIELRELADFTKSWNVLRLNNRLNNDLNIFINSWNSLDKIPKSTYLQNPELNAQVLNRFVTDIDPLINKVREGRSNGNAVNIWAVAGLGHDEVRVSSVFAWFLNCHAEHGQGNSLLAAIIDNLPNKPDQFPTSETIKSHPYWVYVESCASGERTSRIDIEIDGENFLLFIEVKIFAGETNNQLERYIEIAKKKAGIRPWGIIFLTPDGKKPSIKDPMLLSLSWKVIARLFRKHAKSRLPTESYSRRLIFQFSQHVTKF